MRVRTLEVLALAASAFVTACGDSPKAPPAATPEPPKRDVILSIVGTSDLHGHALAEDGQGGLDVFAGYLDNLEAARKKDGGGLVLLDAGDIFQGTLESNLGEGAGMIEVMNALGYDAAAIGNHEFDFGPVGPNATPRADGDDPRGALKARAAEAEFPLLAANTLDAATGAPVTWPNVIPSVIIDRAGLKVGLVGVTSEDTPRTTMAANLGGLTFAPLAPTLAAEAAALRQRGATVVIAIAHAGGKCTKFDDPLNTRSCDGDEEIFRVLAALPPGTVDAVVAGHTHQAVAHVVNGTPVIQSYANGRAFGRIDLTVDGATGKVKRAQVFPPRQICEKVAPGTETCDKQGGPATELAVYERSKVIPHPDVRRLLRDDVDRAQAARQRDLRVVLEGKISRDYDAESALGNLFADLLLEGDVKADAALQNGGGLRADLPAGPLTYGALFTAYPFDNRVARVKMTGAQLKRAIVANLGRSGGILSLGGLRAEAACQGGALVITRLARSSGKPIRDDETLLVLMSDFLATGGDGLLAAGNIDAKTAVELFDDLNAREVLAAALERRGGRLTAKQLFDPKAPRLRMPGARPVKCAP